MMLPLLYLSHWFDACACFQYCAPLRSTSNTIQYQLNLIVWENVSVWKWCAYFVVVVEFSFVYWQSFRIYFRPDENRRAILVSNSNNNKTEQENKMYQKHSAEKRRETWKLLNRILIFASFVQNETKKKYNKTKIYVDATFDGSWSVCFRFRFYCNLWKKKSFFFLFLFILSMSVMNGRLNFL